MNLDITEKSLPFYEALASNVRLKIIRLLAKRSMNIRELAEAVGLSSAIMTMHIKKLEKAQIIRTEMLPGLGKGGVQKLCTLQVEQAEILFPSKMINMRDFHETEVSIGHFADLRIEPTCGIATTEGFIGEVDDPRYFFDPDRFHAKILWFGEGFVEYKIPNFLLSTQHPEEIVVSMEISSEAPLTNNNWPSDITFYLNDVKLGTWTSPGDFGDRPGKYNPSWWPPLVNQYGLLKHLSISPKGTYMDGTKISDITIGDLKMWERHWTLRLAVEKESEHIGGLTIFGKGFGNYNQDLLFRLYYSKPPAE